MEGKKQCKMKTSLLLLTILIFTLSVFLVGCGKKVNQDEIAEDINGLQSDGIVDQAIEDSDIPEYTSYTIENEVNSWKIKFNADIHAECYGDMGVYVQEKETYSEEEIVEIAQNLFDDGKYEIKKPYSCMTREEINNVCQYFEELDDGRNILVEELEAREYKAFLEGHNDVNINAKELDKEHILQKVETEDGMIEECYLEGFVDDVPWTLRYRSNPFWIEIRPKEGNGLKEDDEEKDLDTTENLLDYETAKEMAFQLLTKVGVTDMTVFNVKQRADYDDKITIYGYIFLFTKTTNGKDMAAVGGDAVTFEGNNIVPQEYAVVALDSYGVIFVEVYDRYTITETLSEDTSMLPYSKIEAIANDYFKSYAENIGTGISGSNEVKEIELRYLTVLSDGKYVLMPFWVYRFSGAENLIYKRMDVAINAIDGSIRCFTMRNQGQIHGDGRRTFVTGIDY